MSETEIITAVIRNIVIICGTIGAVAFLVSISMKLGKVLQKIETIEINFNDLKENVVYKDVCTERHKP